MGLLPLRQTIEKGDYYDNADRHRAGSLGDAVRPVRHRDHLFRVEGADKGRYEQTVRPTGAAAQRPQQPLH